MKDKLRQTLSELMMLPGLSGHEDRVRRAIKGRLDAAGIASGTVGMITEPVQVLAQNRIGRRVHQIPVVHPAAAHRVEHLDRVAVGGVDHDDVAAGVDQRLGAARQHLAEIDLGLVPHFEPAVAHRLLDIIDRRQRRLRAGRRARRGGIGGGCCGGLGCGNPG